MQERRLRRGAKLIPDCGGHRGTFTDLVFQDAESGHCSVAKVLSTPDNLAHAVIEGLVAHLLSESNIDFFIHGTTVGLNAVLTRRRAKVAVLTTENYRDVYTIQGNDRREIFSIRWRKPKSLVALPDTFTARERINAKGEVEIPLDVRDLDALIEEVRELGYEAIAICFLFAFRNGAHEREAAAHLRNRLPGVSAVLSALSELLDKAEKHCQEHRIDPSELMNARLAPDMCPLHVQVRFACHQARWNGAAHRPGAPVAPARREPTFAGLRTLIREASESVAAIEPRALVGAESRKVEMRLEDPLAFEADGLRFICRWSLPNFYFHVVTAYDILRHA
jgi:hypothetical protein